MSKEKMTELKIKIPVRWLNFINEYYEVVGRDRDEDLVEMVKAQIEMPMLEDECLPTKERVRLYDKYQLTDIGDMPWWIRDKAAGIPHRVQPVNEDPMEKVVDLLMDNPKFMEEYTRCQKAANKESMIKALRVLPPEDRAAIRAAMPAAA